MQEKEFLNEYRVCSVSRSFEIETIEHGTVWANVELDETGLLRIVILGATIIQRHPHVVGYSIIKSFTEETAMAYYRFHQENGWRQSAIDNFYPQ